MNTEMLEHARAVLSCEPTRTLSARVLHQRVTTGVGADLPYTRFVELLATKPDRFVVVTDTAPFGIGWSVRENDRYATQLERAGVLSGATVLLTEPAQPHEPPGSGVDGTDPLNATLADAHSAVLDLLLLDRDAGLLGEVVSDAVLELDRLRAACAPRLHPRRRSV